MMMVEKMLGGFGLGFIIRLLSSWPDFPTRTNGGGWDTSTWYE